MLHDPAEGRAVVDIVFIHGLKGHREKTWTAEKSSQPWPKALLPSEIPNARVLAYGYDADVAKAIEVVSALARAHTREHLREVFDSTRGILFLGTPHHSSALAVWAERLAKSIGVLKQTNTEILSVLRPESEVLAEIQDNFHNITQSQTIAGVCTIKITCTYEELPLPGIGLVVPQHSAIIPDKDAIGIHGTHHTMVKLTHPNTSVFWVHASNADRFRQAFSEIAKECNIPGTSAPNADVLGLVRSWFQRQATGSWFLVLDNCDDIDLFFKDDHQSHNAGSPEAESGSDSGNLARLIPDHGNDSILITTRNKQAGLRLVPGQPPIEVGPMNDDESLQMIRKTSGDSLLSIDAASVLSTRLANLPLAIAQAAAFMQANTMDIDQYLDILNRDDNAEVQLLSDNFEAFGRDNEIPQAVMATWVVSFEHIKKKNALAAEMMSLMAFFDRQAIKRRFMTIYHFDSTTEGHGSNSSEDDSSIEFCSSSEDNISEYPGDVYQSLETFEQDGANSILLEQALGTFKAFSFIKESQNKILEMHRLVQLATAAWLDRKGLTGSFVGKALANNGQGLLNKFLHSSGLFYKDLPHYQAVLAADAENTVTNKTSALSIRDRIAQLHLSMGRVTLALDMTEENLGSRGQSEQTELYFSAVRLKASILKSLDRKQDAKQTLVGLVAIQPQDSATRFYTIDSHAMFYLELGDYREAKDFLVGAIGQLEKTDAKFLVSKACLMAYLSTTLQELNNTEEAEETCLQVLKLIKEAFDSSKDSNLELAYKVADTFASKGKLQEAETVCRQAIPDN
ncbi:hypothetical protein CSAL01_08946 [Colletotrichum salicis]|uniref:Uncharacterized protein n=1 Tax=Colletotrichum salicis TaxID=1209931 RepID=A0A135V5U7_9PEZI|nr:hypothetical protein CSAL01_08946 [Colletotrichum salicis]